MISRAVINLSYYVFSGRYNIKCHELLHYIKLSIYIDYFFFTLKKCPLRSGFMFWKWTLLFLLLSFKFTSFHLLRCWQFLAQALCQLHYVHGDVFQPSYWQHHLYCLAVVSLVMLIVLKNTIIYYFSII